MNQSTETQLKETTTMKKIFLALTVAVLAFSASAALQPDTLLNGGTNTCASATTNSYHGTGAIIDNSKTTDTVFEFSFTCTNASAMTAGAGATFTVDGAINGTHSDIWITNALAFFVPNNGNTVTNPHAIVTNLLKTQDFIAYRIGEVRNTNISGTNFSALKFRAFTKTGL